MKVTQERLEGSRVALTVEIEPEQVSAETDRAYQRVGSRVAVPGFRPGKAPRHILKNFVGEQRIRQETLDKLVPDAYRSALQETGVEPIADPDVEFLTVEPEAPLSFRATVPVAPTVLVGDYHSIKVSRSPAEVTDEQVDGFIEQLRAGQATWEDAPDHAIEPGDRLVADLSGEAEGVTLADAKDVELTAGQNGLPNEVDEGLTGTRAGEERTVLVTLPEDYPQAELAGSEATYTVSVKSVKRRVLPEIDDAFAQRIAGVDTAAALRDDVRQRLREAAEQAEEDRLRRAVVDQLIARSTIDYPAVLVERQLDRSLEVFRNNLARQGFDPEQYLRLTGETVDALRERWRPDSERGIKADLVLAEVAKQERIEPTEEQIEADYDRIVAEIPAEQRPVTRSAQVREAIRLPLRDRLTTDHLVELALAGDAPAAGEEIQSEGVSEPREGDAVAGETERNPSRPAAPPVGEP